jgi:RHS repeat-associated protein
MTRLMRLARLCFVVFCMGPVLSGQTHTLGTYAYDSSGNVKSIGPDASGLTNFYDYDSAGRLLQFVRKESNGTVVIKETFEYDAFGNLTRLTTNGVVTSLDADTETNRLVAATYDGAGNMLQNGPESYDFDPVGTLTRKSGSWGDAFYIYTADDERIGIEGPDGSWRYMARDVDGKVLREWASSSWNGAWTWSEDYIYRNGQLAAAVRPATQGAARHFHLDHLGSPRLISSQDRAIYAEHAYYPYGPEITSPTQEPAAGHDTPEPMKFTGHERDFAGTYTAPVLDYMHARYYNPQAGRFLSVDPLLSSARLSIPQSWNRYSYVWNNPLLLVDPTGEDVFLSGNTEEERKRELEALKHSLQSAATASQLTTVKVNGAHKVIVMGDTQAFAAANAAAATIGQAISSSAKISFGLGATSQTNANGGAYTAQLVTGDGTTPTHNSSIMVDPSRFPATVGVYQTLDTVIQHELGHALGIANVPFWELYGRGPMTTMNRWGGTAVEAIGAENKARMWYQEKARQQFGPNSAAAKAAERIYSLRPHH